MSSTETRVADENEKNGSGGTPTESQTGESLHKVRDLLFGEQVRDFEVRFSELEKRLESGMQRLQQHFERSTDLIENHIKSETERIDNRLNQENKDRNEADQHLQRTMESKFGVLSEQLTKAEQRFGEQLMTQIKAVHDEISARNAELAEQLKSAVDTLQKTKTSRQLLASILAESALRIDDQLDVAKELTNIVAKHG